MSLPIHDSFSSDSAKHLDQPYEAPHLQYKPPMPEEVDFEKLEAEISRILIDVMDKHRNHFYNNTEELIRDWRSRVDELSKSYSWKNWRVSLLPIVKIAFDVLTIGLIATHLEPQRFKQIEGSIRLLDMSGRVVETAKQWLDTIEAGKRQRMQSFIEFAKTMLETNNRNASSFDDQVAQCLNKLDEAIRKHADMDRQMTANNV